MILYVESNFILELAFQRDEHELCLILLDLAEQHRIRLVLPAFSIGEAYEVLVRRAKNRADLQNRLRIEVGELTRSQPYRAYTEHFASVINLLIRSREEEKERLDAVIERILRVSEIIPVDSNTFSSAIRYQQSHDLQPQDSVIYASIVHHLLISSGEIACFVTRNFKDFDTPSIRSDLRGMHCQLFTHFGHALGHIQHQISLEGD